MGDRNACIFYIQSYRDFSLDNGIRYRACVRNSWVSVRGGVPLNLHLDIHVKLHCTYSVGNSIVSIITS